MTTKKNESTLLTAGCIILLIMLAASMATSGCVKYIPGYNFRPEASGTPVAPDTALTLTNSTEQAEGTPSPESFSGVVRVTLVKSEIVTEVNPTVTPDPYPIIHGTRFNNTMEYNFLYRTPEFKKKYTMSGGTYGLLVNVVEGPLYIVYKVTPQNDCVKNPEECRGGNKKSSNDDSTDKVLTSPQRPFVKFTVRDNRTNEIVAEDGYGGEYNADTGEMTWTMTSWMNDDGLLSSGYTTDDETRVTSVTPRRYIPVYREGSFYITFEGNYADVDLSIITGASPDPLEMNDESRTDT